MCSATSNLQQSRAKSLILNDFFGLPKTWAIQAETRQIKHLARPSAAFPQSYPQKSGTVEKIVFNHRLNAGS
jgi:hypothetical protein